MVSGESRVQVSGKGDRPEASGLPLCIDPVYWSADLIGTPLTFIYTNPASLKVITHAR